MTTTTLDDLEQRFGPSDQDRAEWLAARTVGITATEIRDLYLGVKRRDDLIAEKLGRRRVSHGGNRYTIWGHDREVIIASVVADRFAIPAETRLLRAADNPRFLFSPDGIGRDLAGDVVIEETKTSGEDISIGSPAYVKKGYRIQKTWGMRVAGAVRCLYAWEERHEVDGEFHPGELHFEWLEWDDVADMAAELEVIGTEFLVALDAAASEPWEEVDLDEDLDTLAVNILTAREKESEGKKAKERDWADLVARLAKRGKDFQQESPLARITYHAATEGTSEQTVPDAEAAIDADPALYASVIDIAERWKVHAAKFTKTETVTTTTKASLTVTAAKPPKGNTA